MARYELILKLDGALWPRIILKLLLTPKGAIEDPTNPKKVLKSAPNQPSFCFRVNSFRFDNSFRLDSDHVEDTDNEDVGTDNEDVGIDKDKREMQPRNELECLSNHCTLRLSLQRAFASRNTSILAHGNADNGLHG